MNFIHYIVEPVLLSIVKDSNLFPLSYCSFQLLLSPQSIKRGRGQPLLSPNVFFFCPPPVLNGHRKMGPLRKN